MRTNLLFISCFLGIYASLFAMEKSPHKQPEQKKQDAHTKHPEYQEHHDETHHTFIKRSRITENLNKGQYIQLEDNTVYEIDPDDRYIAMGWLGPATVVLTQDSNRKYPVVIHNNWTKDAVRAQRVK